MKNLRLTKKQFEQIEAGIQIDVCLGGFEAYCIANEYGCFHTPSGVNFDVNFYAPNEYDLTINGEYQAKEQL